MKKPEIEQTVRAWQTRLGLDGWTIAIAFAEIPDNSYSQIAPEDDYDRATLTISPSHINWTQPFANQTIVHELLHLLVRDIDVMVEDAREQLHPQASAQIEKRYEHEIEGLVDRLASRIVEFGGCV